jgi:hypothetical protein
MMPVVGGGCTQPQPRPEVEVVTLTCGALWLLWLLVAVRFPLHF